jgi:hypothetical protein
MNVMAHRHVEYWPFDFVFRGGASKAWGTHCPFGELMFQLLPFDAGSRMVLGLRRGTGGPSS